MKLLSGTAIGSTLEQSKISISGWTEGAYTASSARGGSLPIGFNYKPNQFLLQQNWLRVERSIDTESSEPSWGFRFDTILPGSDYRFTLARGLMTYQLTDNRGDPNLYGIDPIQFYGEFYLPGIAKGLDIKVGRLFAQFGVESIDATQNPLFSGSYNFFYNPFTHTGVLTTLNLDDTWSVQNGLVTGSDIFIDSGANPTYIGSVKWAPPKGNDSVLFAVVIGSHRYDASHNLNNPDVFDLVYTHTFNDDLSYTLDACYSFQTNLPDSGFVNNFGVAQYLTYQICPQLSATGRLEFFDDCQGQKTGFKGLYTALTTGVTYKPESWLWIRPEVRYDYNDESRPFANKSSLFTASCDVIFRW